MIKFITQMKPQAKQRPRKGKGGFYTPQATQEFEHLLQWNFKAQYPNHKPFEGALQCKIECYFEVTKSWTKKKKQECLDREYHTMKPDSDNVAKAILDSLNGLAYIDDCQVCTLTVEKRWSDSNLIVVELNEL